MANSTSDGSITIDTKLDNKGFEKGSQELLNAIKSLTQEINQLGKILQSAFTGYGKSVENADSKVNDLGKTTQNVQSKIQRSTQASSKAIEKLGADIDKMSVTAEAAINGDEKAFDKFDAQAETADQTIATLRSDLEAFGNTRFETEDYTFLRQQIEKTYETIDKLNNRADKMSATGVKENSKAWRALQYDIDLAKQQLATYTGELREMESSGDAYYMGSDTSQFAEANSALNSYEAELREMETDVDQARQSMSELDDAANSTGGVLRRIGSAIGNAVSSGLHGIADAAKSAASALASMAKSKIKSGLKSIASGIKKAASAMLGFNKSSGSVDGGLKSGLKSVLKYGLGIRSLYTLFNKLRSAITEGFESLAQESSSVNSAISSMKSALSTLKNSLTAAFAPIVTAVAPAITYLINLLTSAINYISMFIAALTGQSSYTKAVAVQEDYAASLSDTASSASDAADAVSDTASAVEDANRQLAGFDELNILSNSSSSDSGDSGSGSGSSGGGTNLSPLFEEVAIDSSILDWMEKIKELFANGDYEEIGAIIADGINSAFAALKELISWESVGDVITEYVDMFCRLFNSLVDNIDWGLIGNTFAAGINTILNTVDLLLTGIDWSNLGAALSEGLNGLVEDVDWELVGKTIADYFSARLELITSAILAFDWEAAGERLTEGINSLITTLQNTIDDIDWYNVGSSFVSGINSLITGTDWSTAGSLLGSAFNACLDTIYGAVSTFDWAGVGSAFADGVNGLADKVDWATLGKTIGDSVIGILDTIGTAIEDLDWWQFGEDIKTCLANIDWTGIVDSLAEAFGAALAGCALLAAQIGVAISDAFMDIGEYFTDSIEEAGGDIVAGIFNGIINALANIGTWIVDNIFSPILEGFKNAFGINSPSTVMAEQGKYIIEGLLQGLLDTISGIGTWIHDNILSPILSAFENFDLSETLQVGVSLVKSGWDTVSGWFSSLGTKVVNAVTSVAVGLTKSASNWAADAWTALSNAGQTVVTTVQSKLTTLGSWASSVTTALSNTGKTITTTIKSALTTSGSWASSVTTALSNAGKTITTTIKNKLTTSGSWSSAVTTALSNAGKTITTTISAALKTTGSAWASLKSLFGLASGGAITATGVVKPFASGGAIAATGAANYWRKIPAYAGGTSGAHGTMFVAGEAGPEIVGHIGGRTEVLNKSQLAAVMKDAVESGMATIATSIGNALLNKLAECANAIISAVLYAADIPVQLSASPISGGDSDTATLTAALADLASSVTFTVPTMATGSVMPYSVAQTDSTTDIANAIEASNGEMSDTMVQAISGAASLIVSAIRALNLNVNVDMDSLTQHTIDDINRRTTMFQSSPLKG